MAGIEPLNASLDIQSVTFALTTVGIPQVGECGITSVEECYTVGNFRVAKVTLDDEKKTRIALRIPEPLLHKNNEPTVISILENEWSFLKKCKALDFRWAPRPLARDFSFENAIGFPFIAVSWKEGLPLRWDDSTPERSVRDKILTSLAEIQLALLRNTLTEAEWAVTWEEFYSIRLRNRLDRVVKGLIPELSSQDCHTQKELLSRALGDDSRMTLMAIEHGNIVPHNILVTPDGNITCLVDWTLADRVPAISAAGLPHFLWDCPKSHVARQDRTTYVAAISRQPESRERELCMRYQTGDNVDFRHLYLESLRSKGVHASLAARGWKTDGWPDASETVHEQMSEQQQLKAMMEDRRNNPQVLEVQDRDEWFFDCVCGLYGKVDDGEHAIACERCSVWQHSKCLGIEKNEAEDENFHFKCDSCKQRHAAKGKSRASSPS